jgi:hypothetical protein
MANLVNVVKHPTNLQAVNLNSLVERDVQKYFNNFFDVPVEVSSNIDTAVIAYFETITDNKESARALASAVIYTSVKEGKNPMEILKEFQKLPPGELDAYTTLYLNLSRVGTSFLGITNQPVSNNYITRTILA